MLNDEAVASMKVAAVFSPPRGKRIVSLTMHRTALLAAAASADDCIRLYDMDKRKCVVAGLDGVARTTSAYLLLVGSPRVCHVCGGYGGVLFRIKKELQVKKRGAALLQFTHHPSALLYAATKSEHKGVYSA